MWMVVTMTNVCTDDGLREGLIRDVEGREELGGAVVVLDGPQQVRVAVGEVREGPRQWAKAAESAIGAADHADVIPEVSRAKRARHHRCGARSALARLVDPAAFADVIDLCRHDETLVACRERRHVRLPTLEGAHGRLVALWESGEEPVD